MDTTPFAPHQLQPAAARPDELTLTRAEALALLHVLLPLCGAVQVLTRSRMLARQWRRSSDVTVVAAGQLLEDVLNGRPVRGAP